MKNCLVMLTQNIPPSARGKNLSRTRSRFSQRAFDCVIVIATSVAQGAGEDPRRVPKTSTSPVSVPPRCATASRQARLSCSRRARSTGSSRRREKEAIKGSPEVARLPVVLRRQKRARVRVVPANPIAVPFGSVRRRHVLRLLVLRRRRGGHAAEKILHVEILPRRLPRAPVRFIPAVQLGGISAGCGRTY